jgi:hypothetical protein
MKLWDLKRGDTFIFADDPKTELIFLKMDGFYAQVRALDPEKNEEMCARYDAGSDFFCISSENNVIPVTPEIFKIVDTEGGTDG